MKISNKISVRVSTLRKIHVPGKGMPIYMSVDTSPIGIGWVINQEGNDGGQ